MITIYTDSFFDVDTGDAIIQASVNHDAIIKAVLYWDNIIIPNTTQVGCDISHAPWIKELRQEKILIEPTLIAIQSGSIAQMMYDTHMAFIEEAMSIKEINFSVYNLERTFKKRRDVTNLSGGESLTLANALPIPSRNTNINEVLEFKEKRKDNLGQLMAHLNTIELQISQAENKGYAVKKAINEIDIACRDIIRLHKESGIKFNLSNAKFNFSFKEMSKYAGYAYGGAVTIGLPHTAAVIAGIVSGISTMVEIKDAISLKKIDKSNPFNFVGQMSVELNKI